MKYLCLIYDDESLWERMPKAEVDGIMGEFRSFTQDIKKSGHMAAGEQLQPTSTATTVRIRDGRTVVTDGPYAETKEQLGGFYLIEARDLNEAIQVASRIPSARLGSIEVRPIVESHG
ncbi:MAG: YciI family protein [Gemmatimonadaceae bacterium]